MLLITLLITLIVNRCAVLKHWHLYINSADLIAKMRFIKKEDNDPGVSFNHHDLYVLYTLRAIFLLRRRIASFLPSICFEKKRVSFSVLSIRAMNKARQFLIKCKFFKYA